MFIQDLYERKIYLILFIMSFIVAFILSLVINGIEAVLYKTFLNLCFTSLLVLLILLFAKFCFRSTNESIGAGDIVFLYCITPILSPLEFINFICLSALMTLVIFSASFLRNRNFKIPLAGTQSLLLAIYLIARNSESFSINHFILF
jgi:Flp pilus assembly protein protease CpaA